MSRRRYVIVGDGAAGTIAAQTLRARDPRASIHIIADDPNPAYFRAALTNYLIGELREDQIWATPPHFYSMHRIDRTYDRVVAVDTIARRVRRRGGPDEAYDALIIAAGARARRPPFAGADLPGVMVMRTLQDVRAVMDHVQVRGLDRAVIVGGGPLALEWVQGLHARGVAVTYLLRRTHLMRRRLDSVAGDLVLARLRLAGVDVRVETEVAAAIPGPDGRLAALLTNHGERLPCRLAGVAIGVEANGAFLAGSGVDCTPDGAVRVDAALRAGPPDVYAAGDIASVDGFLPQLWEPARRQGRVAALNASAGLSSATPLTYEPGAHYNATRLFDLDVAVVGDVLSEAGARVLLDFPRHADHITYRKLVVRDGRLVGALLLGERRARARAHGRLYQRLIDAAVDVSALSTSRRPGQTPPLLDPAFDLSAWLERQELVRRPAHPAAPLATPARLRRSLVLPRPPAPVTVHPAPARPEPGGRLVAAAGAWTWSASLVTLGRDPANHVALADTAVSHIHAQIERRDGVFYLRDLGSRNGTWVNGARVIVPQPIRPGDRLRVGETTLRFDIDTVATPAAPAPVGR